MGQWLVLRSPAPYGHHTVLPPTAIIPYYRKLQRPSYSSLPATPSDSSSSLGGRPSYSSLPATPSDSSSLGVAIIPYYRKLQRPSYSSLPATPSDSSSLGGRPSYSSLPATPSDSSSLGGHHFTRRASISPNGQRNSFEGRIRY